MTEPLSPMADPPLLLILGGPNGAGKSTAASALLPDDLPFVNADEIAKTLPGYPSRGADLEAGRLVLIRLDELERMRASFAIETTLAGRSLAPRVERLRGQGYLVRLIFIWVPSPELSVQRVAVRVRSGGHAIPEATIRRRFQAGLRNLFGLYQPIVDRWEVFENATAAGLDIIAGGHAGGRTVVYRPELWRQVVEGGR
ncbi:Zeta toxin [Tautonia plasticadhaerens]|uniref:Zeta toxin n=2 Tax=Tautonia plasticadhaerens TaxID=2527974 RepID=A0A518H2X5_9BACT|nr:Zeta toxin [Tautonia plasticadhaerens]